jgi:hypothetical protein
LTFEIKNMSRPAQPHNEIISVKPGAVEIAVSVVPRSSRCEIAGIHNNALRIKLTSPPVDNEANKQCCEFIAKQMGIARRQVAIIRGQTSRHKVLRIEGVVEQEVQEKLLRKDR